MLKVSPVIDPLSQLPGYLLRRVSAATMQRLLRKLSNFDLRVVEASILLVIEANPNLIQGEVGRLLGVASPNMAPLVGRLEGRGLIIRRPVDGRSQGLTLTPNGHAAAVASRIAIETAEADILAAIEEDYLDDFCQILKDMIASRQG